MTFAQGEFDMWYSTGTETQQTIPPVEATAEQQSDSSTDRTATAADPKKASTSATPGTEYWLP
jgi:hypothetical protein